ncbi:MAG: metal ABC transporter ATP-binding protein [Suipraeoptans sp.]
MPLIRCENLKLGYEGRVIAEDINFELNKGDYLCIVGENGSGKSTLMHVILGLKAPIEGQVITGDGLLRNEIGYLPQQTVVQKDFPASVEEIIFSGFVGKMGMRIRYSDEEKQQVKNAMEKLGITQLRKKCYRELSGGQQQRVLLARALLATSKVILLDEPTAGLDLNAANDMYDIIRKLNQEGIGIIMITHDIKEAVNQASHILHMSYKPLYYGTTDGYLASDASYVLKRGVK